ncbi:MAG TPA: response regulator [Candidatus Binataceae bacterium]|nr:response regulator [Candidatus Binataceae bacterium]
MSGIALAKICCAHTRCGCASMAHEMKETSEDSEQGSSVVAPTVRSECWRERFMAALSCASESDLRQLKTLLRTGLGIIFLAESGRWLDVARFEPALLHTTRPFFVFDMALLGAALCLTYLKWFEHHWRAVAMALCLILMTSRTLSGIAINQDEQLMLSLFVLGTALLVPWGMRWQAVIALAGLIAFTIAARTGIVEPNALQRWLLLVATIAFTLSFTALKDHYRSQALLIEELRDGKERLRAENADRRRTGAHLRRSEAMMRQLFDAVPDLVTVSRLTDGKFIEVNAEFLKRTGLSREKALTTSTLEIGQWVRPEERQAFVQKLKADGHVREFEVDFRLLGAVVPYLASSVVVDLDGEPCTLGVGHDITRIKESERALHEAQQRLSTQIEELTSTQRELIGAREAALAASQAKSEFLSSMSHEIRTPMNAILGMAELLEETPLNRDQKKFLGIMRNNGGALLLLINDILDLAKVEAGRLTLERIDFDLENLTDKVIETLGLRAHSKSLELAVHLMPDVPRQLGGDPLRLRQILINLIGNAIKFTETGQVLLTVERDPAGEGPGALLFTVSDTGIGIAADKLDAVFSNFTQADSSTTRRYGGSGLGLAIAKRLVALMDGRIWAESELGAGSAFHFTARFEEGNARLAKEPSAVALILSGIRALVVDDNATNRLILREMLTSRGAEVSEAEDGPQGLVLLERARLSGRLFKLLLLDCRMPGMDGFQVAERIKAIGYDGMSILMLTSDDLKIELAHLKQLGLGAYLVKPVRRLDLFDAIAAAMAGRNGDLGPAGGKPAGTSIDAAASPRRSLRVRLAEDSRDNRILIRAYLKNSCARIDEAENGLIAIEQAKAQKYDLVLMDIQMPVMDGLEAIRLIRRRERQNGSERVPIIALTASALESDVHRSLEAGADLHVSKPVKKATLLAAIESVTLVSSGSAQASPEQDHEAGKAETDFHATVVA